MFRVWVGRADVSKNKLLAFGRISSSEGPILDGSKKLTLRGASKHDVPPVFCDLSVTQSSPPL